MILRLLLVDDDVGDVIYEKAYTLIDVQNAKTDVFAEVTADIHTALGRYVSKPKPFRMNEPVAQGSTEPPVDVGSADDSDMFR